jgi:hypothetical protein
VDELCSPRVHNWNTLTLSYALDPIRFSQRFYEVKPDTIKSEGPPLRANVRAKGLESRGKRKLSKEALTSFPKEIVGTFAHLPKVFKKMDIDRLMGDKISRSMKWRYIRRMEKLGIVKHSTKKYYRKVYDTISDWMEKDAIPKIRRMESLVEIETS